MATKRVAWDKKGQWWRLLLDGTVMCSRLESERTAECLTNCVNAALDETAKDARTDERERCAMLMELLEEDSRRGKWLGDQIRKEPA